MYITGIGTIGIFGLGKDALLNAVNNKISVTSYESLNIDIKSLVDKTLFKKLRRADRFTKLVISSVNDAINNNQNQTIDFENCGIILATAYGPHNTTFKFLDELLEYGEKNVSPIKFSNSVHNAAASYIAQLFGIKGPVTTISNFINPVDEAFKLADCWLNTELCENIIICFIDEKGDIYNRAFEELMKKNSYPTEGSCSFIISAQNNNLYASVNFDETNQMVVSAVDKTLTNDNFKNNDFQSCKNFVGDMAISKAFDIILTIHKII